VVGLVLDGRGRPLATANNKEDRRLQMIEWAKALNLYPEG
jgi:sulfur transfer protein SufE